MTVHRHASRGRKAAGLADTEEYTQNLFRLKMVRPGKETGAGGGRPRDMVAVVGKPYARALRATRPAQGTTAGEQSVKSAISTIAQHKTSADNKNTRLDGGQDNGELSDMAQKYGTTLDTASVVFPRLGYAITYGANNNSQLGPVYTKIEPKASTLLRQDKGELGNMAEQLGTTLVCNPRQQQTPERKSDHHTAGAQTYRQVPGIKNR